MLETDNICELLKGCDRKEIARCYPVVKELRPHLEESTFIDQVIYQLKEGYRLIYLEKENEVKAIAGFRILTFLAWGKVLYIDDLATSSKSQKLGYGSTLIKWLIQEAKSHHCDQLHLDSGPQRHDAHRLYLNHGMKIIGYHFALDLEQ